MNFCIFKLIFDLDNFVQVTNWQTLTNHREKKVSLRLQDQYKIV